jgi:hypothetical protein
MTIFCFCFLRSQESLRYDMSLWNSPNSTPMEAKGSPSLIPSSFFQDNHLFTRLRKKLSHSYLQENGVPQRRRLFSITINDSAGPSVATSYLFYLSGTLNIFRRGLQEVINQILQRDLKDGFSFAATSFQILYFPSKRGVPSRYIQYLKSTHLPVVSSAKYLGPCS